jgi:hypothetical protein
MRPAFSRQIAPQIDDRVADELAWPVVRHVAATVHLMQFNAATREPLVARQDIRPRGVPAKRNDRRVLKQKERIADQAALPRSDHALLNPQRLRVGNAAEMEKMNEQQATAF